MEMFAHPPSGNSKSNFLVSDLCSIAWLFYAAAQFWTGIHGLFGWCALAFAVRLLASIGPKGSDSTGSRRRRYLLHSALALSAVSITAFALAHSWRQAGALGVGLVVLFGVTRVFGGFISRGAEYDRGEGLRFGALQCTAFFAVYPYIGNGLLGAGDANSYSLLIADFLHQWRSGLFPVFVGQSEFAFNGGFHPLRNAPYFLHLAGLLDILSLRTLGVFAVMNLTVWCSMLGAVLGCYSVLRILLSRGAWVAFGLTLLFSLSPAILAPLYGGDMYPTFMTLPFVPWLILGIERSVLKPGLVWPWLLQAGALAAIAMAHPPVACWAAVLVVVSGLWVLVLERKWQALGPMFAGMAFFAVLVAYLFVSVRSLELPAIARDRALAQVPFLLSILRDAWLGSLLPVSPGGNNLLEDVQLGYGLWTGLLLSVAGAVQIKSARPLLAGLFVLLLLVWPIPILAPLLWRALPSLLLVTNLWPMERLYLLMAGVTAVLIALACRRHFPLVGRQRLLIGILLAGAGVWSASEVRKFFHRSRAITQSGIVAENLHRRGNILMSRTHSYEYVGTPAYFSHGHMDPRLETRLLDLETRQPFADGTTLRMGAVPPAADPPALALQRAADGSLAREFSIGAGQARILRFDFLGECPEGELGILGARLSNAYRLPLSGLAKSFGCGPAASRTLIVDNDSDAPEAVSFRFVPAGEKDLRAQVSIEPWSEQDRIIKLRSQTPFDAVVTAERDCYLETPKLFIPGYEALVDGAPAKIVRSAEGLVAIPLAKGEHQVRIYYRGGPLLRWSYGAGIATWLVLGGVIVLYALRREAVLERGLERMRRRAVSLWQQHGGRWVRLLPGVGAVLLLLVAIAWWKERQGQVSYGAVRMTVRLPWPEAGKVEPLVTTGRTGAGDFIYVVYLDGKRIQIGHDRWGYGGVRSEPISVDYAAVHTLEISLGSLYADEGSAETDDQAPPSLKELKTRVTVSWNGLPVVLEKAASYASRPDEVTVGKNTIGGSTTLPQFSGVILKVQRVKAPALK